jgi:hypothetical protein
MADNRNKNQGQDPNQNKTGQQQQKPQRSGENEGSRQQSGNRQGSSGSKDLDKDVGNQNRDIQKDVDTDETDEGEQDEQGEITQRNPRMGDDQSSKR